MENLFAEIASIECWLRDHPDADHVARWEMISRLREMNNQLNLTSEKLKMLNRGESPLKMKYDEQSDKTNN